MCPVWCSDRTVSCWKSSDSQIDVDNADDWQPPPHFWIGGSVDQWIEDTGAAVSVVTSLQSVLTLLTRRRHWHFVCFTVWCTCYVIYPSLTVCLQKDVEREELLVICTPLEHIVRLSSEAKYMMPSMLPSQQFRAYEFVVHSECNPRAFRCVTVNSCLFLSWAVSEWRHLVIDTELCFDPSLDAICLFCFTFVLLVVTV